MNSNFTLVEKPIENVRWLSDMLLLSTHFNRSEVSTSAELLNNQVIGMIVLLVLYFCAVCLNIALIVIILRQRPKRTLRVNLLISTLASVNVLWSLTWIVATAITVFVASGNALGEDEPAYRLLDDDTKLIKNGLWEIVAHQLVDNVLSLQAILLLEIAFDRYLNMFENYTPYVDNIFMKLMMVLIPIIVACTLFDHRLLALVISMESALFCRLCLLVTPAFLTFLFSLVATFRPKSTADVILEAPRLSSLSSQLPVVLLLIATLEIFWRTSFFFRLLELNFDFVIVASDEYGNQLLTSAMDCWFWIASWQIHVIPLLYPVLILTVRHYRLSLFSEMQRAKHVICCKKEVNYGTETMRSIISDQQRRKQQIYVSSIH